MYKIKPEVAQGLLNYLATKPFAEVYQLINALQSLEKIDESKQVEEPSEIKPEKK